MQKKSSASKIRLPKFDTLFGMNETMTEAGNLQYVQISELYSFRNHPFKVRRDKRMDELIASVRENGVLVPGVARIRPEGGYEIISGHSRKYACEQAGIRVMPMFIRNVTDDEATIIMVDSNIQREDILPSEKAWAYKLKYDAIKHQGKKGNSLEAMKEMSGESRTVIQRYIQLASLSDDLLGYVDNKKIGFSQGVELSHLNRKEQSLLFDYLGRSPHTISVKQAKEIRDNKGGLSEEILNQILDITSEKTEKRQIKFDDDTLKIYFPLHYSENEIKEVIIRLLKQWYEAEGGQ